MDDQIDVNSTGTVTTVFVVDDDDGVRTSLGILLDSAGYRAVPFASAADFLAQYDPARPGCLLLDMRMPGMTGMELIQEVLLGSLGEGGEVLRDEFRHGGLMRLGIGFGVLHEFVIHIECQFGHESSLFDV